MGRTCPPYIRLSAYYFFLFAVVGGLLPLWPVYLRSLGFGPRSVAQVIAIFAAASIVVPTLWAWVADRYGQRMPIVRLCAGLGLLAFVGVAVAREYWPMVIATCIYTLFWNGGLPQFEVTTLSHLRSRRQHYGRIRLWGSIGFIAAVLGMGLLVDKFGIQWLPVAVLLVMAGVVVVALSVPEASFAGVSGGSSLWPQLRNPAVGALFLACLLMQASHGPFYVFFSLYLEDLGHGAAFIGAMWSLGVGAEVALFAVMPRIMRFELRALFLWAFVLTAVRWLLLMCYAEVLWVLVFTQLLHAASFGLYHAVAMELIHELFDDRSRGRGQALYSSLGFGVGGALGAWMSGLVWTKFGPGPTWLLAAVLAAAGGLVVWRGLMVGPRGKAVS